MILGIDASNIRAGGGITHLVEILKNARPIDNGFTKVIILSGVETLEKIPDSDWLFKVSHDYLGKSFLLRCVWRIFLQRKQLNSMNCDVLFVPGGTDISGIRPLVSMSQNMLPFEWKELARFKLSFLTVKLLILRFTQSRTFKKSDGVIFLTEYARAEVSKTLGVSTLQTVTIPHGIDRRFFSRPQKKHINYDHQNPCRVVYVSIVDMYKHQWNVAEAVSRIRDSGVPITLDLIGPAYPPALRKLTKALDILDPKNEFIFYRGAIPHDELQDVYKESDINVFASSCENLPNILLEAMASGLPVASSDRGPMPEVLGDEGIYFNPESPSEIVEALTKLIDSPELRLASANYAYQRACEFNWKKCSDDTFRFIAETAKRTKQSI